jgi:lysozyme
MTARTKRRQGRIMDNDKRPARRRVGAAIAVLLVGAVLTAAWTESRRWTPDRARFPVQGAWLDAHDGPIDWRLLKAGGADFAYLTASEGAGRRDEAFSAGLDAARAQAVQVGAVHVYDLCAPADAQAANFVTIVPRDAALLPPAISLDLESRSCPAPPGEAAMQSELTTFLNQIEKHTEKPAILMVSRSFESRYRLAALVDRNLWVRQDFLEPGYAGPAWVMWTATGRLRIGGMAGPVRWVVVRR